jgi:hypothetical protein
MLQASTTLRESKKRAEFVLKPTIVIQDGACEQQKTACATMTA